MGGVAVVAATVDALVASGRFRLVVQDIPLALLELRA